MMLLAELLMWCILSDFFSRDSNQHVCAVRAACCYYSYILAYVRTYVLISLEKKEM